ncbi:MAG: hypothetical protein D6773_06895 [Alphaproteobacteria bacterium]|nr:MAG: hypothetical protein D6773_06895 [Alphaproteobacteria bacterium]
MWPSGVMPVSEIAERLGRDPSTLHREIRRNTYRLKDKRRAGIIGPAQKSKEIA